jgi:hypothetical protein
VVVGRRLVAGAFAVVVVRPVAGDRVVGGRLVGAFAAGPGRLAGRVATVVVGSEGTGVTGAAGGAPPVGLSTIWQLSAA